MTTHLEGRCKKTFPLQGATNWANDTILPISAHAHQNNEALDSLSIKNKNVINASRYTHAMVIIHSSTATQKIQQ